MKATQNWTTFQLSYLFKHVIGSGHLKKDSRVHLGEYGNFKTKSFTAENEMYQFFKTRKFSSQRGKFIILHSMYVTKIFLCQTVVSPALQDLGHKSLPANLAQVVKAIGWY